MAEDLFFEIYQLVFNPLGKRLKTFFLPWRTEKSKHAFI